MGAFKLCFTQYVILYIERTFGGFLVNETEKNNLCLIMAM